MTRYKTHLIAVKKLNHKKEAIIMRDICSAMESLVVLMSHHHNTQPEKTPRRVTSSPASHIYCYDAKVIPFPYSHIHN